MSSSQPHKRVTLEDIQYSISEEDKTASVTRYKGSATEIIIPRSIKHESKEYIITIIASGAFVFSGVTSVSFEPNSELRTIENEAFSHSRLARIQIPSHVTQICERAFSYCRQLPRFEFEPNSELRTIGKDAFKGSALARIQIPAGAVELEDGWCDGANQLFEVEVEPGNARYSSVGGKVVIGKSDIAKEDYDTLVFCARDSTEANIPATIKIIGAYAFSQSKIASIQIPSHVTQICEYAFYRCDQLSRVEFEPNSELRTIGAYAFTYTALTSIQIPSHVTQICEGAFYGCEPLSRFEFEPHSELRTIKKDAFSGSALARIQIPSHVTQICEGAFSDCEQLSRFEFEPNSELRTIKKDAFSGSALARIQIPASAVELEDGWCDGAINLIEVEVEPGNVRYSSVGGKLVIGKSDIAKEDYDTLVFCARDSIEVNIPATIKIIGAYAFSQSKIASIQIPSHVTQICERAFSDCEQLSRFEFEPNSELRTIGEDAFSDSALASIQIPSHVTQIHEDAFSSCLQLQIVEIGEKTLEESIGVDAFIISEIVMLPARGKRF